VAEDENGRAEVVAPHGIEPGPGEVPLSGRTQENKLVHLAGTPDLVGHFAMVAVEHAGPYALRGRLVPGDGTSPAAVRPERVAVER
jgi:hypothetical protein